MPVCACHGDGCWAGDEPLALAPSPAKQVNFFLHVGPVLVCSSRGAGAQGAAGVRVAQRGGGSRVCPAPWHAPAPLPVAPSPSSRRSQLAGC